MAVKHPAHRGQTKKHAARKKGKHHAAHHMHGKHHPAHATSHLQLQRELTVAAADLSAIAKGNKSLAALSKEVAAVASHERGASLTLNDMPVCAVQALAESLHIAGKEVDRDDVLALFHMAGGDVDKGTSILEALVAAQWFGLAGAYPVFRPARKLADGVVVGITIPQGPHTVTMLGGGYRTWSEWRPVLPGFEDDIEEAWEVSWR